MKSTWVGVFIMVSVLSSSKPGWGTKGMWNVVDAGAAADGKTDATSIFQKLLDQAGEQGGGTVFVPAGRYRIDGNLTIPAAVTLEGVFTVPPTPLHEGSPDLHGTILLAHAGRGSPEGDPFIRLAGHMACLSGVIIVYPEWKKEDVPPVPYPPCILAEGVENVGVFDTCLVNPYEGIRLFRSARHIIRNVFGYPIRRGLFVDECYDIGRVENCHFWPFGVIYQPDDPYCEWINTQGTAFEFARTDWQYVLNTFCFGYGVGYKFSRSKAGSCNGNFLGIGADSCRRAVLVEQCQPPGLLITNGEFVGRWQGSDSVCVEVGEHADGKVSLQNCSFWGPIDRCLWLRSPAGQLTAIGCHFVDWDNTNSGVPAIQIDAGTTIVQGNTFVQDGLHVLVGESVTSAILMGNQAPGGFRVENHADRKTRLIGNQTDPLEWAAGARSHYIVDVGAPGDGRFLRRWFGREGTSGNDRSDSTWRWSGKRSEIRLPVLPGKNYTVSLWVHIPGEAVDGDSGIYLGENRIVGFSPGSRELSIHLPGSHEEEIPLTVRTKGWIPGKTREGSHDNRSLGIQLGRIEVEVVGEGSPDGKAFDANRGRWVPLE